MKTKQTKPRQTNRSSSNLTERIKLTFNLDTYEYLSTTAKEQGCSVPALIRKLALSFLECEEEPAELGVKVSKRDITRFQRAAAVAEMDFDEWVKAVLRGAVECELEPVPDASASPDEETASLVIKLSKRDIARCRRAAVFCDLPFNDWAAGSLITSMECDEDDMLTEGMDGGGREFPLGRERSGWELREAMPDPIAQGY